MKKWTIIFAITTLLLLAGIIFLLNRDGYFRTFAFVASDHTNYDYVNPVYLQRESLFEVSPMEEVDRLFLGDSITARGEWSDFFPGEKVVNRGIDSDVTAGVLNRLDVVIKQNPKKIFLMVGINDIRQEINPAATHSNYEEILKRLTTELPDCKIYVQSVLPAQNGIGIDNTKVQTLNEDIKALADQYHCVYINIYDELVDEKNALSKEFSMDGVHLTGQAYEIWIELISKMGY